MSPWILLLRGINVGGTNRLPMRELAALLEGLGLREVRTAISSGNIVFTPGCASPVDRAGLEAAISAAIHASFGFAPRAMLVEADRLREAIDANPFPEAVGDPKTLHLFVLDGAPASPDLAGLAAIRGPRERFVLDGAFFYLHTPDGLAASRIAVRAERLLGVVATARNWNTVRRLAEMAGA